MSVPPRTMEGAPRISAAARCHGSVSRLGVTALCEGSV
nr:small hypothetical protein SCH5.04c - Streptomyces coelicolor [Streptomyces coelicolor]